MPYTFTTGTSSPSLVLQELSQSSSTITAAMMARHGAFNAPMRKLGYGASASPSRIRPWKSLLGPRNASTQSHLIPRIGQSSLWQSILPRNLRNRLQKTEAAAAESKPRKSRAANPASYFIWIWILIGSQAIRILQIQHEYSASMQRAEVKIEKLRRVVEALRRGEEVDVERALGTGDEAQELEWEEALREIEQDDRMWQRNKQGKLDAEQRAREKAVRDANDANNASPVNHAAQEDASDTEQVQIEQQRTPVAPGFY